MTEFQGFPSGGRVEYTSIPNVFFSGLLPQITDMAELKVTLYVISVLYHKKGYPRFVSYSELLGNASLIQSLKSIGGQPEEVLRGALKSAAARGTMLTLTIDKDGTSEDIYFLNTESDRQAVIRIEAGTLELVGVGSIKQIPVEMEKQPNIYKLYEDNIGMLTPITADQLRDAEKNYPEDWIRDAIQQAVIQGKRKWSVVSAILQRWSIEGRSDGTYQRHIKKADPDKFVKGKYGRMVRRR